jgi:hypothetical protein
VSRQQEFGKRSCRDRDFEDHRQLASFVCLQELRQIASRDDIDDLVLTRTVVFVYLGGCRK